MRTGYCVTLWVPRVHGVFWPPCARDGCWSDLVLLRILPLSVDSKYQLVFLLVVEFYDHLLLGLCFNLPYLTPCTIYYLLELDKPLSMCVMYILYALWFLLSSYVVLFMRSCVDSSLWYNLDNLNALCHYWSIHLLSVLLSKLYLFGSWHVHAYLFMYFFMPCLLSWSSI